MSDSSLPALEQHVLERLFGDQVYQYDLVGGTVKTPGNMRMIYLSSDIVRGIYEALSYEAGEAWKIILQSCGYLWGKNVFSSLGKDLKLVAHQDIGGLSVNAYLHLLEAFFANHGWGQVRFHLDDAPQYGIVRVSLRHSLFVEALNQVDDRVDAMIAGMLHGFFERISGNNELGCVEAQCARHGREQCEFLITAASRLERIEADIEEKADLQSLLAQLRTA